MQELTASMDETRKFFKERLKMTKTLSDSERWEMVNRISYGVARGKHAILLLEQSATIDSAQVMLDLINMETAAQDTKERLAGCPND